MKEFAKQQSGQRRVAVPSTGGDGAQPLPPSARRARTAEGRWAIQLIGGLLRWVLISSWQP
eukprot:6366330-Lingulodinium_polyedra.AAC.1